MRRPLTIDEVYGAFSRGRAATAEPRRGKPAVVMYGGAR